MENNKMLHAIPATFRENDGAPYVRGYDITEGHPSDGGKILFNLREDNALLIEIVEKTKNVLQGVSLKHWRCLGIQRTFRPNKSTVNKQKTHVMNQSKIENVQPEPLMNEEQKPIIIPSAQVSANALVVRQGGRIEVAMRRKGYFGIGCLNMKTSMNFGTLFRTAQVFGADFIFLIGCRFKSQASDTMKSWKHIPTFIYKDFADFNEHRPYDCKLIGIELIETATPLREFKHPKQACYLLGAEDNGLTKEAMQNCQEIIYLPGENSLNVSVAGSIVLYDRLSKL